ncbi:glucan 1,4-alpha-glucosidase [Mesorhizobium sp. M7A.F.Ca.CA.001.09.2.1]|uniref:Glucan 1,4-alpha-glucosidase n=2 Tax=Mesorhizobium TaxID=68287 RepID=A0AB38TDU2_9HYPH|nr:MULTISPECIES: glucan 1,4-alpha-glucosidase [Mesorhizobium]RUY47515.1 glucan 1,4-alpha-glucosidase [Mesorhizobium sp. M7A.F.Ca.CA.001.13.2.1]MBZ9717195.1 glucan 1,4-alpha-glucosidase [Mesorhizobium sp. AD1-1]MDF3215574.1 glucan 1,4-alpha-glucosidase [Mesorhizobium ciceri]RUY64485.1 glucan 1,4-alpha-glucosidase [Mesorhizobium sp. M7A.F.Ca.CA.001.05.1.1]RUY65250.1 glucan 1,4-alpha-glucosidase [Mesorhizobium sp. M7A.F.Ca.CA.001.13.1.1]
MPVTPNVAPGAPGIPARWTSSAKSGVGTSLSPAGRIWFTISHGILNEIYYSRVDSACTRDLGLIVTGAAGYFSEEKRDATHSIEPFEDGVPAYRLVNTANDGAWRIEKRILADPARPALLQEITFTALRGAADDYRVYALLAPHLVNAGMGNTAWVGEHEGKPVLFASGRGSCLALASSLPWRTGSAGYVGFSDGWQQLHNTGELDAAYQRAEDGNVALTGEIGFSAARTKALLALGFGATPEEAAEHAFASLKQGFEPAANSYLQNWRNWQKGLLPLDRHAVPGTNFYRVSTAVLATHRSIATPGAAVASLSIPWGFDKGDDDLGGYHLVWPRDLVETAGGFLAAGDAASALQILDYLGSIQQPDGHWPQNAWLDGSAYWPGIQMDECAFPLLLAEALHRAGHLPHARLAVFLPMIERAAGFVVRNGPVTGEDRWEEDAGYSPFTLAVEIAALLAAADLLDACGKPDAATYLRETSDVWNDQVERWTYVTGTAICGQVGVEGYYVRIAPPDSAEAGSPKDGYVPIKNRPPGDTNRPAEQIVSPDALALVRFGLRAADDPRMTDTVKVIDAQLRCDLPQGPLWYRYNGDGYGEHEDGAPFDGTGQGRPWPLLAGERAHYELAAGRREKAASLLAALEGSAGPGGLLPEQVWDGADMPERELLHGRPSGSAMPLVWAHSEHIKLLRSLRDGAVFDMPPQGVKRYIEAKTVSPFRTWRFNNKIRTVPAGKTLRVELLAPATVHWSTDNWATAHDSQTVENDFGIHLADLAVSGLPKGSTLTFTFFWPGAGDWENVDFSVISGDQDSQQTFPR